MQIRILKTSLIIVATSLVACGGQSTEEILQKMAIDTVNTMVYIKDKRTDLCFGIPRMRGVSVTNVPCDKVENYLIN